MGSYSLIYGSHYAKIDDDEVVEGPVADDDSYTECNNCCCSESTDCCCSEANNDSWDESAECDDEDQEYDTEETGDDENSDEGDDEVHSIYDFEAKYHVPLFWLTLFESSDLKTYAHAGYRYDDDSEQEYIVREEMPYLSTSISKALANGHRRRPMLARFLDEGRMKLYDEWLERVKAETSPYLIITVEQLAQDGMADDYAAMLQAALTMLDAMPPEAWLNDPDIVGASGLTEEWFTESQGFTFTGFSHRNQWPREDKYPLTPLKWLWN